MHYRPTSRLICLLWIRANYLDIEQFVSSWSILFFNKSSQINRQKTEANVTPADEKGLSEPLKLQAWRVNILSSLQPFKNWPILDLHFLNWALHKLPLKMLTQRRIFGCIRPRDWFAAIDLKDVYFHVSILPCHRPFLRFVFEGRAYQYKVLALRPVPVTPCLYERCGGSPCSPERAGHSHSQLPRRLAHTSSVSVSVVRTQGLGALIPQPVGPLVN